MCSSPHEEPHFSDKKHWDPIKKVIFVKHTVIDGKATYTPPNSLSGVCLG